ncbi:hypothetical protein [Acinetobacter bereziniae]|uniref:hypothetical protein n=1 Tax=Acinetobacter bereziniae TaxID=106648 RepID=UPI00148F8E7A|nr:hypothetical protein [Acinetobacter bereziniae]
MAFWSKNAQARNYRDVRSTAWMWELCRPVCDQEAQHRGACAGGEFWVALQV